jgi:hypothetical protein
MITGVIPTGTGPDLQLPYGIELLPSGFFYDGGARIEPLIRWTVKRMVIAGVQRIIVTMSDQSLANGNAQAIMSYLKGGEQFLTQIVYAWTNSKSLPRIVDSVHDFLLGDTVVVVEPHYIYKPPDCITQAMAHTKDTSVDGVIGQITQDKHIYVLNPALIADIRELAVESDKDCSMEEAMAASKARGRKVASVAIHRGQATSPIDPIWIPQS